MTTKPHRELHGGLSTIEYFTFGFGTMIGVGWVVLMDDWLSRGGPGGGMLGYLIGGLLLFPIAHTYGRLVQRIQDAGAEMALLSVQGTAAGAIAGSLGADTEALRPLGIAPVAVDGRGASWVARRERAGELGFDVWVPAAHREVAQWLRHQAVLWWVTTDRFIELCSYRI